MIKKISPDLAAHLMGKSPQFVRIGLQRNLLPIGNAVVTGGSALHPRYSYYISPKMFMEYTGMCESDIRDEAMERGFCVD